MKGSDLLRVIPVVQALGLNLTVVSVELYTACIAVRYLDDRGFPRSASDRRSEEVDRRFNELSLTDDLGTDYFQGGGHSMSSEGSGGALLGDLLFTPAVPTGAAKLTLSVGPDQLTLPI